MCTHILQLYLTRLIDEKVKISKFQTSSTYMYKYVGLQQSSSYEFLLQGNR